MRNIPLIAGLMVAGLGMATMTASSALAADVCLNPATIDMSMTQGAMQNSPGYNVAEFDAAMAKGNRCSTTQQSLPLQQKGHTGYDNQVSSPNNYNTNN